VTIPPEELKPALWDQPGSFRAEFDFSRDAVMRSLEGTLKRLGTDYVERRVGRR
jgi:D-threo-aldose 1-dehydrogenase